MPEQEDLVWLDRKTDGFCIKPDLGVRADDGADHRIYGGCMGGDNRDVTSHYFHASKLAAERSLLIGDKSSGRIPTETGWSEIPGVRRTAFSPM